MDSLKPALLERAVRGMAADLHVRTGRVFYNTLPEGKIVGRYNAAAIYIRENDQVHLVVFAN